VSTSPVNHVKVQQVVATPKDFEHQGDLQAFGGKEKLEQSSPNAPSYIKSLVLAFLVLQNCSVTILMRYSRSQLGEGEWSAQTGVIVQEVMKAACSLTLLLTTEGGVGNAFDDPMEVIKSGVPAFLYVVQNNMQYVAAAHLDAPSCAVLAQLKVLTTAIFSITLLGKSLSRSQWVALVVLAIGVSFVTVSQMESKSHKSQSDVSVLPGVLAMLIAATTSGLAATYFEKILKGSQVSMWARQLQLALFSIAIGAAGLLTGGDWEHVSHRGFFGGYTVAAWITILVNAVGGMLVALALKLADAIVKNFSASIAIVLTAVFSAVMMGTHIGFIFACGVLLVIYAVLLYGGVLPPVLRCANCVRVVSKTSSVDQAEPCELQEMQSNDIEDATEVDALTSSVCNARLSQ